MSVTLSVSLFASEEGNGGNVVFTGKNMSTPYDYGKRDPVYVPIADKFLGTWYESPGDPYMSYIEDYKPASFSLESWPAPPVTDIAELVLQEDINLHTTSSGDQIEVHVINEIEEYKIDVGNRPSIVTSSRENFFVYSTASDIGNGNYNLTVDRAVASGSNTISSGTSLYLVSPKEINVDFHSIYGQPYLFIGNYNNCIEVTDGNAFNCRLTAWEDDTHTTTTGNELLYNNHLLVTAMVIRGKGSAIYYQFHEEEDYDWVKQTMEYSYLAVPPVCNRPLNGNISYYGDFDLMYAALPYQPYQRGEILYFKPRLYDITNLPEADYDCVITLHYQYT